jgi:hypothetical protein
MESAVDVAEAAGSDVSIDFGGGDCGVTEEFLNDAEIGAVFEQVRGKTVPQHVGCHIPRNPGQTRALLDPKP